MKKKIWDIYAPLYERFMRSDEKAYRRMYERIPEVIRGKTVLEIATGPGLIAKHVAPAAKRMIATDYAEGMIREAKKGVCPENLSFAVADATALPYEDDSFDVVIIANALHVMPDPEQALSEIDRVLKPDGVLIAPNFVHSEPRPGARMLAQLIKIAGIRFEAKWTAKEYIGFLEQHGFRVVHSETLAARITMLYTECVRR